MSTLKRSERNCIIEDFRNGIINPNYEVIQTKTKGRYTVRKRKVPLTEEQIAALDDEAFHEEEDASANRSVPKRKVPREMPHEYPSQNIDYRALMVKDRFNDLQNQLNQQMLYRLNELTNKVVKLKTWKKKLKQELYTEDVEQGANEMPHETPHEMPHEMSHGAQPVAECTGQEYLNNIPQEYVNEMPREEPHEIPREAFYEQNPYEPARNKRSRIDYSKFGF